ncbi:MAG TPA: CtsR family transcriptional regulator [Bacillota bacterium]
MRTLVDIIEQHIRSLIERSHDGAIAIQRAELAEQFRCVPSQISYVIDTRFTPERGYVVESRRGGGGYIRIVRVAREGQAGELLKVLGDHIGDYMDQRRAENIIERLLDEDLITEREAALLRGAVRRESIPVQLPLRDALRAKIFYNMLTALVGSRANAGRQRRPGRRGREG